MEYLLNHIPQRLIMAAIEEHESTRQLEQDKRPDAGFDGDKQESNDSKRA